MLLDVVNVTSKATISVEKVNRIFGGDLRPDLFIINLSFLGFKDSVLDE